MMQVWNENYVTNYEILQNLCCYLSIPKLENETLRYHYLLTMGTFWISVKDCTEKIYLKVAEILTQSVS